MLLAIDIGNTSTACGVWNGQSWLATWRRDTNPEITEGELAPWLVSMLGSIDSDGADLRESVVPALDDVWVRTVERVSGLPLRFLRLGADVGLNVDVEVPSSVGADRLANCLGADG